MVISLVLKVLKVQGKGKMRLVYKAWAEIIRVGRAETWKMQGLTWSAARNRAARNRERRATEARSYAAMVNITVV